MPDMDDFYMDAIEELLEEFEEIHGRPPTKEEYSTMDDEVHNRAVSKYALYSDVIYERLRDNGGD